MASVNIIFAGFGGQGVLFAGKVTAYAGLKAGREVSWLPSYGPEMRGGTANCSVVVSDSAVSCPLVTEPDVLVAMNQPSFDKFKDTVARGGVIIADSTLIKTENVRDDIKLCAVDATRYADENGLKGLANMILLGRAFAEADIAPADAVERALEACVPPKKAHLIGANKTAMETGKTL